MSEALDKRGKTLLYADNAWYLGEGMLGPLFAVFTERVGGDVLEISWAWAIYLLIGGLLIVWVGKISDHVSKKKLLVVGYFLNALCTFGYLLVSTPWHLFLVQGGLGIAVALATPTWNALYTSYENKRLKGTAWGLSDGQAKIFTGIAIIIGGLIVTFTSFTTLFIVMGIVQLAASFYLLKILRM